MAAISTIIAGIGLGIAAGGAALQYSAAQKAQKSQEESIAIQQRSEALRQQQMNLDATRRKREIVRTALAQRAAALTTTTNQGASGPGGSSLAGAYGSIAGREGVNELGVSQNQELGNSMFTNNRALLQSYRGAAAAATMGALGSGISSLGNALVKNQGTIGKIGDYFFGPNTNVGSATSWSRA